MRKQKKPILYCETTVQDTSGASIPLLFLEKMHRTTELLVFSSLQTHTHTYAAQRHWALMHQAWEVTAPLATPSQKENREGLQEPTS